MVRAMHSSTTIYVVYVNLGVYCLHSNVTRVHPRQYPCKLSSNTYAQTQYHVKTRFSTFCSMLQFHHRTNTINCSVHLLCTGHGFNVEYVRYLSVSGIN